MHTAAPTASSAPSAPDTSRHAALVTRLCRHIEGAPAEPTLTQLAELAGLSPTHLLRVFKAVTGLTPKAYAAAHRARRLREGLSQGERVTDAMYDAGFGASSRLYEAAPALLGMTPSRFRAGGVNERIRFALGRCSLGELLVAGTERGLCAILLGENPDALLQALQDAFPRAELLGGDAGFEQWVAQVVGFVDAPQVGLNLPLDIRGTAFQQRVWQALREVPIGSRISYAELAQRVGMPKAVRAVASACAANSLAVVIPCHRVVRTDGSLSGYRWGVARKQALLAREAAAPAPSRQDANGARDVAGSPSIRD